jgi:hypothetical protein
LHAEIHQFLQPFSLDVAELKQQTKAGIIPYLPGSHKRYYVMKPVASKPDLGLPEFQLCKGTRMYKAASGWADMRGAIPDHSILEPLAATALREGIEELGLVLSNIVGLKSLGEYSFQSATSSKPKTMFLFAAGMKNEYDFLASSAVAATTAERAWLTLEEFKKLGRPDHYHVLSQIEIKL